MTTLPLTTAALVSQLDLLRAGDRAWFWLCVAAPRPTPPLLLQPLSLAKAKVGIRQQVAGLSPLRARPVVGLARVSPSGLLTLGGPGMHRSMLEHLARWTAVSVSRYPRLARLKDTTLLDIAPDGTILARYADPSLWSGLAEVPVADTLAQTRRNLSRTKPGRRYWFWAALDGPDGQPFLSVAPTSRDPKGMQFAKRVLRIRRMGAGEGLRGTLHRSASGRLIFATHAPLPSLAQALSAVLDDSGEEPLLLQTAAGQVVDTLQL